MRSEQLVSPAVPLSLRLSAILLQGLAILYERKIMYVIVVVVITHLTTHCHL